MSIQKVATTQNNQYYFGCVVVRVQNTLFRVPRRSLETHSDIFLLLSPSPREELGDGWVADRPLVLSGFSAGEFASFLMVLYPLGSDAVPPKAEKEPWRFWEAVLKVTTVLHVLRIRRQPVKQLQKLFKSLPDGEAIRLLLSRKYNVPDWLVEAYDSLVNRRDGLSDKESKIIGWKKAIDIYRLRESRPTTDALAKAPLPVSTIKDHLQAETTRMKSFKNPLPARMPKVIQTTSSSRKDVKFYLEDVVFQVEDELFNVPRFPFSTHSEVFTSMFSMPPSQDGAQGAGEQNPIRLESISKQEFKALLEALYIPLFERDVSSWHHLAPILRLSTMWRFKELRQQTITLMTPLFNKDPDTLAAHLLSLGHTCQIPGWIIDGYYTLVIRDAPLSNDERCLLRVTASWNIYELRDRYTAVPKEQTQLGDVLSAALAKSRTKDTSSESRRTPSFRSAAVPVQYYVKRGISKDDVKMKVAQELKEAVFAD